MKLINLLEYFLYAGTSQWRLIQTKFSFGIPVSNTVLNDNSFLFNELWNHWKNKSHPSSQLTYMGCCCDMKDPGNPQFTNPPFKGLLLVNGNFFPHFSSRNICGDIWSNLDVRSVVSKVERRHFSSFLERTISY